jgi:hypothetical protein
VSSLSPSLCVSHSPSLCSSSHGAGGEWRGRRFRKVRVNNATFHSRLGRLTGGRECMQVSPTALSHADVLGEGGT